MSELNILPASRSPESFIRTKEKPSGKSIRKGIAIHVALCHAKMMGRRLYAKNAVFKNDIKHNGRIAGKGYNRAQ